MTNATRFPLDFDALRKGDVIGTDVIERYRQHKGIGMFEFAAMDLKSVTRRELAIRGLNVVIVHERDTLRILLDSEASTYSAEEFHKDLKRAIRHHRDLLSVDQSKLDSDELAGHERSVINNSKYVQALAETGSRYQRAFSPPAARRLPDAVGHGDANVQVDAVPDRGSRPVAHEERADGGPAEPVREAAQGGQQPAQQD